MITQLIKLPRTEKFVVACSGGVDSMAAVDFYLRGGHNFTVAYFNHATPQANGMEDVVSSWCSANKVLFLTERLSTTKPKNSSPEEFWRNERYAWLNSLGFDTIVTAHHLNDAAETWIFSSMHGDPKLIAPRNGRIVRPFLLNEKEALKDWCVRKGVRWFEDKSNEDNHYPRNRIRNIILPECLKINPGLLKVIKKKYLFVS